MRRRASVGTRQFDVELSLTAEQFEQYFGDLLRSLEAIEFFKSHNPEHIMRTLRSLTFRAAPDSRELSLLRAVAMEIVHFLDRAGAGGGPRRGAGADHGGFGAGGD